MAPFSPRGRRAGDEGSCKPCCKHGKKAERSLTLPLSQREREQTQDLATPSAIGHGMTSRGLDSRSQLHLYLVAFVGEAGLYAGANRCSASRDPAIPLFVEGGDVADVFELDVGHQVLFDA